MNNFKESLKPENFTVTPLTEREARRTYEQFVLDQEKQFILFINYLNKFINALRDQGKVTPHLAFYARVKATNSAYQNHSEKKALDDAFGIEILATSAKEYKALMKEIESSEDPKLLQVHKITNHNKDNGYKAEHHYCVLEPSLVESLTRGTEIPAELFPLIEFQYKTFEVYYQANFGTASHERYKRTKIKQIQSLYDTDLLTVGEYIPTMWVSDPYNDNVRELSSREVLKKMYPSLKLKDVKKSPEPQEK